MPSLPCSPSTNSECQICAQPAHGYHFGAFACRACSAFFRRAVFGRCSKLPCTKTDGDCAAFVDGKLQCRNCRYKLCLKMGMKADKIQQDHDLKSSSSSTSSIASQRKKLEMAIPKSTEIFLGRPHYIIFLDPDLITANKLFLDVGYLIDKSTDILKKGVSVRNKKQTNGLNSLEKMTCGLNFIFDSCHTVRHVKSIGVSEMSVLWEENILQFCKFLTYCDMLNELPEQSKLQILKCAWMMFSRYKHAFMTIEQRQNKKENFEDDDVFMITKNAAVNFNRVDFDFSWISNYTREDLYFFLNTTEFGLPNEIMIPLMKLRPTPVEQTFMICQICFNYVGHKFQGEILQAVEKFEEKMSDDLHNYYNQKMQMPNYSRRLVQLLKINNMVKEDCIQRMERKSLARTLELFKVDFSDPELFFGFK